MPGSHRFGSFGRWLGILLLSPALAGCPWDDGLGFLETLSELYHASPHAPEPKKPKQQQPPDPDLTEAQRQALALADVPLDKAMKVITLGDTMEAAAAANEALDERATALERNLAEVSANAAATGRVVDDNRGGIASNASTIDGNGAQLAALERKQAAMNGEIARLNLQLDRLLDKLDDACVPSCAGRICGGDGCGGSCGACAAGQACAGGGAACPCAFEFADCDGVAANGCEAPAPCGPVSLCGDGIVDPTEQCDDGNMNHFDECTNDCTVNPCGGNCCDIIENFDGGLPALWSFSAHPPGAAAASFDPDFRAMRIQGVPGPDTIGSLALPHEVTSGDFEVRARFTQLGTEGAAWRHGIRLADAAGNQSLDVVFHDTGAPRVWVVGMLFGGVDGQVHVGDVGGTAGFVGRPAVLRLTRVGGIYTAAVTPDGGTETVIYVGRIDPYGSTNFSHVRFDAWGVDTPVEVLIDDVRIGHPGCGTP